MKRARSKKARLALVLGLAVLVPVGVAAGAVGWHVYELNSGPMMVAPENPIPEYDDGRSKREKKAPAAAVSPPAAP